MGTSIQPRCWRIANWCYTPPCHPAPVWALATFSFHGLFFGFGGFAQKILGGHSLRLRALALALRALRLRAIALALRALRLRAIALALRALRLRAIALALRALRLRAIALALRALRLRAIALALR